MISVEKALEFIQLHDVAPTAVNLPFSNAIGMILAEDILSPINMPPFRQSAMDGYAIQLNTLQEHKYRVIGEMRAGDSQDICLGKAEAVRISTGAMLPKNADTIVVQEQVKKIGEKIHILKLPSENANIRAIGEQIQKDELALKRGTKLNEASIGFLAGLGINEVKVFSTPKVAIIVTGNELQAPGSPLKPGKVFESNSIMLKSALLRTGFNKIRVYKVGDDARATKEIVKKALEEADVLLCSGGISVGEHDYVEEALAFNNVEEIFYKVNQKPGKPLWFGKKKKKTVFALPGNPAASLTCFYVYILPLLMKMKGFGNFGLQKQKAKVDRSWKNTSRKSLFLQANLCGNRVCLLDGQSSSMLRNFTLSNALIFVHEDKEAIEIDEEVECLQLGF